MTRIILSGCNGRMGRVVTGLCQTDPTIEIVAGFDILGPSDDTFPVFSNPALCDIAADVLIDFSSPAALPSLLNFGQHSCIPLVLATTGYSAEQLKQIQQTAELLPIFRSANMSLGINVLLELVQRAAGVLSRDYDIEIIERHHNKKLDAPSGTALMIADAASSAAALEPTYIYERQSVRKPRSKSEIGISSVRGGTIVGDHTILFAGHDETIEITHHAASREIFATGALHAAKFLCNVSRPGLYDMSDLLHI